MMYVVGLNTPSASLQVILSGTVDMLEGGDVIQNDLDVLEEQAHSKCSGKAFLKWILSGVMFCSRLAILEHSL